MDTLSREIQAAFAREQVALGDATHAQARLLSRALEEARRPDPLPRIAGGLATVAVALAIAVGVLLSRGHLRQQPQPNAPVSVEEALTSGPAAAPVSHLDGLLVWLIGDRVKPQANGSPDGEVTGIRVEVVDATGRVRYGFDVPNSSAGRPNEIQSISADGRRALLGDGTVIDQTGGVVGRVPALKIAGMPGSNLHWMADDQEICAAFSNEPLGPFITPRPKGQANQPPPPAPNYTKPGSDHSVTLKIFGLNGSLRTVATVGAGSLGEPLGPFGDSVSVLSCSAPTDLAVIARYHDADISGGQTSNNMTVSVWAIKLSTGAVLYHQPETRMALGRAFFFGSQNARLAVEFLWNSKVAGSETDVVLQMPSGRRVPVLDAEPIPDTPAVSADGTRILRRLVDQAHNQTDLELIDANNGRIIRRVVLPGILGASAVAVRGSASFLVQVESYFALVDKNGGVSLLHLNVPNSVGLPPTAVQN